MFTNARPDHKIRHRGLTVPLGKNAGTHSPFYTVLPRRRSKQGQLGRDSDRCGEDDLLPLARLLDPTQRGIRNAEQAEQQAA